MSKTTASAERAARRAARRAEEVARRAKAAAARAACRAARGTAKRATAPDAGGPTRPAPGPKGTTLPEGPIGDSHAERLVAALTVIHDVSKLLVEDLKKTGERRDKIFAAVEQYADEVGQLDDLRSEDALVCYERAAKAFGALKAELKL